MNGYPLRLNDLDYPTQGNDKSYENFFNFCKCKSCLMECLQQSKVILTADAKSTTSYFLGLTFLGIIMSVSDLRWQCRSLIKKSNGFNSGGVQYVWKISSTGIDRRFVRNIIKIPLLTFILFFKLFWTYKCPSVGSIFEDRDM